MFKFKFALSWDETIDKLYEHIISNSKEFLGVPNEDVNFRIIPNNDEKYLTVIAFTDKNISYLDELDVDSLNFTEKKYKTIYLDGYNSLNEIRIVRNEICLNDYEIHYIKFDWISLFKEIGRLFNKLCCECLKITVQDASILYNSEKNEFVYTGISTNNNKIFSKNNEITDISNHIKKIYI